jgi:hypothetical protein
LAATTHHCTPVFRFEVERRKWNRLEGAWKRSAHRSKNWGLTPLRKLARYANSGEGFSSGASGRALASPVADSSDEKEEEVAPAHTILHSADYILNNEEEATVIQLDVVISESEAGARFRREEAEAVRAVRAYEAAQKEAVVRRVKQEVVDLDSE